jgi:PAS domain S-box-containing protein
MDKNNLREGVPPDAGEMETLRLEKESLAQQVKRLIKAEGKLYDFQEQLDAQLREYKELYELNRKLIGTFNIRKMLEYACEYVINKLEYERVVFFERDEENGDYAVYALDGYYDQNEKAMVSGLLIREDDSFLSPLFEGGEYLICKADCELKEFVEYRDMLMMNEYLIYPLVFRVFPLVLMAVGNSAGKAEFYRRVNDGDGALLGVGNLVGLLTSLIENRVLYNNMKNALELERVAEAKYRGIFENAVEGIFQTSSAGRFIRCNPASAAILGYDTPEELIEKVTDIEHQLYVDPKQRHELFDMMMNRVDVKNFEVEFYRKDGSRQWVIISVRPIFNEKGEIEYLDGIMLDIAERKRAEEQIRNSLKEKEILLKEIHHRVKNNLQIISTLLDLQSDSFVEDQSRRFFEDCQNRIRTMAMIHEKLYETSDFVSIDFGEYLENLTNSLFTTYVSDRRITLTVEAGVVVLEIDDAIPCGLIVNELVSNSMKYAFPEGRTGNLAVRLDIGDDDRIALTIEDNGVGLPPDLDFRATETLGLQLVNMLVKQLHGEIELEKGQGTIFRITFRRSLKRGG